MIDDASRRRVPLKLSRAKTNAVCFLSFALADRFAGLQKNLFEADVKHPLLGRRRLQERPLP